MVWGTAAIVVRDTGFIPCPPSYVVTFTSDPPCHLTHPGTEDLTPLLNNDPGAPLNDFSLTDIAGEMIQVGVRMGGGGVGGWWSLKSRL